VAAASNSKTLLGIKEQEKQHRRASSVSSSSCYCSICGKKLKHFKRRGASQKPLSCWQCMITTTMQILEKGAFRKSCTSASRKKKEAVLRLLSLISGICICLLCPFLE
jgi:hypothetical protein